MCGTITSNTPATAFPIVIQLPPATKLDAGGHGTLAAVVRAGLEMALVAKQARMITSSSPCGVRCRSTERASQNARL
jgi:hypothetical protein